MITYKEELIRNLIGHYIKLGFTEQLLEAEGKRIVVMVGDNYLFKTLVLREIEKDRWTIRKYKRSPKTIRIEGVVFHI